MKMFLLYLPGPQLLLGLRGLFHFFIDVSPADVTSIENRLVHYSLLNYYFHHVYKWHRVRIHLLRLTLS
jgi:hypothetical protein